MSGALQEGLDEVGDLLLPSDHPVVSLAQNIRLKGKKKLQRAPVVVPVGKKAGVERSVDILPKQNLQTL